MRLSLPLSLIALALFGCPGVASAQTVADRACDAAFAVLRDYARDGEKMVLSGADLGFQHPLSELETHWRTKPPTALLEAYLREPGVNVKVACAGRRDEMEALGFELTPKSSWDPEVDQSAGVNVAVLDAAGAEALVQSTRAFRTFGGHCLLSYLRRENGKWKIVDQRPICVV
ncbi:MAG: hypothetical protein JWR84_1042 [Caulobacter sp.]|nr:hypothetical protein [Caulobacter sp.]